MTREETKIVREASRIIARELSEGREVRIPKFGRFFLRALTCRESPPWIDGDKQTFIQTVARFKPFKRLRLAVLKRHFLT